MNKRRAETRDRLVLAIAGRLVPYDPDPLTLDSAERIEPTSGRTLRVGALYGHRQAHRAFLYRLRSMPTWWLLSVALLAFALPASPRQRKRP